MPLAQMPNLTEQKRDARNLRGFGRLAPGVTLAQARAELATIAGRLAHDYPDTNKDIKPTRDDLQRALQRRRRSSWSSCR